MNIVMPTIIMSILLSTIPLTLGLLLLLIGFEYQDDKVKTVAWIILIYGAIQHVIATRLLRKNG